MKELKHNDKIKINGKYHTRPGINIMYGNVGTLFGCSKEDGFDYEERKAHTIIMKASGAFGWDLFWTMKDATFLSSDTSAYDRRDAENAKAIELTDGEQVLIEGEILTVKYMGDYSDFIHLITI